MEEQQFFKNLLEKTREVFLTSKTYSLYGDRNWNFAVCETPIKKKTGVFFGLNWGGDDTNTQSEYPKISKERNWNFISHSRQYFRNFLHSEIEQLNYSNLCFFRSPKAYQIHKDDWELVIPLFKEYIDYINPPWSLLLGNIENLGNRYLTEKVTIKVWDKKHSRSAFGYTGCLFGIYPFAAVPHPQARISAETRQAIWNSVVKGNKNFKTN